MVSIVAPMRLRRHGVIRALLPGRYPERDRWNTYLTEVEPQLVAQPRVHRFAVPPVIGEADLASGATAVWIDGSGEAATRTRTSLQGSTHSPTQIIDGPLREALGRIQDERVLLIRAGDEVAPLALERLGQAAALAPDAAVITCDSDKLSPSGVRHTPQLRPGPSPDHWLACDDSGPLLLVNRTLTLASAQRLTGGPGWRHELALALAGPNSATHGHVPMLLCHEAEGPAVPPADLSAILSDWDPAARVELDGSVRRVRRRLSGEPSVEVIICFRDRPELLARCVDTLRTHTRYERLRLTLVDNGSTAPATRALLERLERVAGTRVVSEPRAFHFAALNNAAAQNSSADVLVFLNNDTEIIEPDWVTVLLEEALRPEVGTVAPMLLYHDGTVQHAGAAIGLHGYAGHPFAGLAPDRLTPFGSADSGTRNWLAVTAACLMVERSKFLGVGGFDESFVVAGNDVDLGLRLTAAGHRSLCVPHARLLHHESRSRGAHIDPGDFAASERSYGAFRTVGDPFYNPNLTLSATDCRLRSPAEGAL